MLCRTVLHSPISAHSNTLIAEICNIHAFQINAEIISTMLHVLTYARNNPVKLVALLHYFLCTRFLT